MHGRDANTLAEELPLASEDKALGGLPWGLRVGQRGRCDDG